MIDLLNAKCSECDEGWYVEATLQDSWAGNLTCNTCSHAVNRFAFEREHKEIDSGPPVGDLYCSDELCTWPLEPHNERYKDKKEALKARMKFYGTLKKTAHKTMQKVLSGADAILTQILENK